jgi:hypothetical protein
MSSNQMRGNSASETSSMEDRVVSAFGRRSFSYSSDLRSPFHTLRRRIEKAYSGFSGIKGRIKISIFQPVDRGPNNES